MSTIAKLNEQRTALCTKRMVNKCREVRFYNPEGTICFWAWKSTGREDWNVRYGRVVISQQSNGEYALTMSHKHQFSQSANGTTIPSRVKSRTLVMELAERIGTLVINNQIQ